MPVTLIDGPTPVLETKGREWQLLFGDTARPGWAVLLTLREMQSGELRCVAAHFDAIKDEDVAVKWVARFPLARCVNDARLALQQLLDGGDPFDIALPFGRPARANRLVWYPQFLECVEGWQTLGMTVMESYREVARRKRVKVTTVKQWAHQAQLLRKQQQQASTKGKSR
jgi:hypothetical protein